MLTRTVKVHKIGNSKGVIIPPAWLDQLTGNKAVQNIELVMRTEGSVIIIEPLLKPRQGWAKAAIKAHARGDDSLLIPDVFEDEKIE
ncbi:MAG: AbrB/MazE/SpoVT family DNA-binding domain-containing protein [Bacteroidetes bacterium]|nr:AbrB/MazE/SpoVT family DNA-binding domain-containing protein [Bacteroidota bacterium]MCH8232207.1 AbrB/MazE/SpoVT family DNA-binding domain-containing protein [Bacteroidota bacterium]